MLYICIGFCGENVGFCFLAGYRIVGKWPDIRRISFNEITMPSLQRIISRLLLWGLLEIKSLRYIEK